MKRASLVAMLFVTVFASAGCSTLWGWMFKMLPSDDQMTQMLNSRGQSDSLEATAVPESSDAKSSTDGTPAR
jgi:hypothetical protein